MSKRLVFFILFTIFALNANAQGCNDYCANGVYANANYNPATNDCEYTTTQCANGCNFFGNACATSYNPQAINENPIQNNYSENNIEAQQVNGQFGLTQPNFQTVFNVTPNGSTPTLEELSAEAEQAAVQAETSEINFEHKVIFTRGSEEKELTIKTKGEIELLNESNAGVKINGRNVKTEKTWSTLVKSQLKLGDVLENILIYTEEEKPIVAVQKTTSVKILGFIPA